MRRVECSTTQRVSQETYDITGQWYTEVVEIGLFHGWGVEYEEFDTGPGNYSVAIVELPDGQVKTYPAYRVKFTEVK